MSTGNTYHAGNHQYWYDRSTKCWWAAKFDGEGNQVGDAFDAYTKREILGEIRKVNQAAYDLAHPRDPVEDARIAKRAAEFQAAAPARAKERLAKEMLDSGRGPKSKGEWIDAAKRYLAFESRPKSHTDGYDVPNVTLNIEGTYRNCTIVYVDKNDSARQECGGAMIPGPWASTFGNATCLTAQRMPKDAATPVCDGDVLSIDGIDFRVRVFRREYIALDRIESDGSLQPNVGSY